MDSERRIGAASRYLLKGLLGEGAQGATYEATDSQSGRTVAIKRFDVRGARSWKDVELAEREARVLATLDHPLVPRYLENFEEDGALYLVMERVEGETLDTIRKREGTLSEAEVRRFLACADRAFTYLHGRGTPVVHRDVKPRNIVRRPDGNYVFVDFGAVSEFLVRRDSSTIVGTMGYMAPEQLQARGRPASDVYAVGATALAALTGVEPETLPHRGLRVDVQAALQGRVSDALIHSLERMLEPDPDLRAQSIGAALESPTAAPAAPLSPERPAPAPLVNVVDEDAAVKSIRKLLWALWGIGWIVVPIVFGELLHLEVAIPLVMFGWLALNVIAGWHRGALLRLLLRQWNVDGAQPVAARQRIEAPVSPQVRVKTSDLGPDEVVAGTEVHASGDAERQARRKR
jgi:serine/threonine protein kinase